MMSFQPHPRLYIGHQAMSRIQKPAGDPLDNAALEYLDRETPALLESPVFPWSPTDGHNAHLIRARRMQTRVVTLLAAWLRSGGEERYRASVIRHVEEMDRWEDWSWIAWREGKHGPDAIFDLSYGENCATLALAYDLTAGSLSETERRRVQDIAARRALAAFRKHTDPANLAWWMNRPDSNWLPVCAGGGGMLALALAGDLPDMEPLIARADEAVMRYMQKADEYGGGCVEGLAYWNYGMRYAFMYLLSHEAATGQPHPALSFHGSRQTLRVPLDFNPRGVPCGFGDINQPWHPLPFHFAAADRFSDAALLESLENASSPGLIRGNQSWPLAAELLLLRPPSPKKKKSAPVSAKSQNRIYPKMDWGVIASSPDYPRLAATVRGGTTEVPHGHTDLFSYHLVLDGESMVATVSNSQYVDTTFSDRRDDIWEMRPDAKNMLFVGGVSVSRPASVKTEPVTIGACHGFHLIGHDAIRATLYNNPLVKRLERLFLMQDDTLFVVVDHVECQAQNQIESRFHTYAKLTLNADGGLLEGKDACMQMAFAATAPIIAKAGLGTPSNPSAPVSSMVRLFSAALVPELTLATVFSTGREPVSAVISNGPRGCLMLTVTRGSEQTRLTLPFKQEQQKT